MFIIICKIRKQYFDIKIIVLNETVLALQAIIINFRKKREIVLSTLILFSWQYWY